jgi:restriction system protein
MPIPDYQTLMLPILQLTADGKKHAVTAIRKHLTETFQLTAEELSMKLKGGTSLFSNRVGWAVSHLNKAELLQAVTRAVYSITDRGIGVLKGHPAAITTKMLKQFPEFTFQNKGNASQDGSVPIPVSDDKATPEELLEQSFQMLREALAAELLDAIKTGTPAGFEQIVVDLLVGMGYGGSVEDAGKVVGKSGDGGIDGIIKQDKLGLDVLYVQAKRWKDVVGSPEIMKFSGSLTKRHASKGVFITTSYFSKDALEYVEAMPQKIVLIDGAKLALLMIDHNVGVSLAKSYDVKRLDQDYFESL